MEKNFKVNQIPNRYLIPWVIVAFVTFLLMSTNVLGAINDSGYHSTWMLDTKIYYDWTTFRNSIGMLDSFMISGYMTLHIIDYIFLLAFYPLLAYFMYRLRGKWDLFVILPFIAMGFDFSENLLIDIALYHTVSDFIASLAGFLTLFKFLFLFLTISIMAYFIYLRRAKRNGK
ncbi:MAG: hypothetical protein JXL85_01240 [Bacilli bacterium]|nr:hypothetical protein [Bacilli bacterium]